MFHVICLETGELVTTTNGVPTVYMDGRVAALMAQNFSAATGKKHQPRPVKSDDWKQREQARFDSGQYIRLPWAEETWFAGKYEEHDLCFAKTPDEIERVYVNGPDSCMSAQGSEYDSGIHPARVYGAGDLAIAYLRDDGEITARAICWPDKLVHGRIYGDEHRLNAALIGAGYTYGASKLRGAKLLRIRCDEGFVAPYIDGCPGIEDDGDYLRIGGDLPSDSTTGVIREESGEYCPCCEEYRDEEFYFIRDRDETWCESCTNDNAVFTQPRGDYCAEDYVTMANGEHWTPEHFERNGGMCEATEENYPANELVYLEGAGTTWCFGYFRDHGFTCDACGENFSREDQGARRNHCAECSGEAPPRDAHGRYKARQSRDEHPDQPELGGWPL